MTNRDTIAEPAGQVPIVRRADLVVVGGGPAGIAAAVAGARSGLSVTLLERYAYLGGLASGGMVLVLDDMCNGPEISVRGLCSEMVERMERIGLCVVPPESERRSDEALWRKWSRWGVFDFHSHVKPQPICYAAAFDPDGFKRASNAMVGEAKVDLRLHSWFSRAIVEDGSITGVVCETKSGRQAIMGKIVVDATGDLDVAASAGAPFTHGSYIVTTVFRLGGVDVDAAERFEYEEPGAFRAIDREAKKIIGGSWDKWWLKTPLQGDRVVQLPAHDRSRRNRRRGSDERRFPGPRTHRRARSPTFARSCRASRTRSSLMSRRRSGCARRGSWTASMW